MIKRRILSTAPSCNGSVCGVRVSTKNKKKNSYFHRTREFTIFYSVGDLRSTDFDLQK
jgi:hypothetical protein